MISWAIALSVLGAVPTVDVVVLSKHRPTTVRFSKARCRVGRDRIDRAERAGDGLSLCRGLRCWAAAAGRAHVHCSGPAALSTRDLEPRTYGRAFLVSVSQDRLRIVARLDEARYVDGVVASELAGAPKAALRAQAIVARAYVRYAQRHPRHTDAPVCDLTHCQVLREAKDLGLDETRTLVTASGDPSPVFFHSTCGGHTVDAHRVWPSVAAKDALVGVDDTNPETGRAWCAGSPHFQWVEEISAETLADALRPLAGRPLDTASLSLQSRDRDGLGWEFGDRRGTIEVSGRSLHRRLGRALGWSRVKSSRFTAIRAGAEFRLRGQGLGHGVGLCQVGAMARARAGRTAEQILQAYFPKLRLHP